MREKKNNLQQKQCQDNDIVMSSHTPLQYKMLHTENIF